MSLGGAEAFQAEVLEGARIVRELLRDVGENGVLPDQVDPLRGQVGAQEVAGPDRRVAVLEEPVGAVDGAGPLRALWRVVLPMSQPMLVTVVVITAVEEWNNFVWPLIVTNTASMRTLPVGLLILKDEEGLANWGTIMAGTLLVLAPMLIIFLIAQRYIVGGITQGALKG